MTRTLPLFSIALIVAGMLLNTGCEQTPAPENPKPAPAENSTVTLEGTTYRVTGPHSHQNMAIYVLHSDQQDPREFITLDEGLKSGEVKVSEKPSKQVSELIVDNSSTKHLFLHEGDRVRGGDQDRTIFTSFVVKPQSGPQPLPSFCIEAGRWSTGATGAQFAATGNACIAPKDVRIAAKVSKSQGAVWDNVASQKDAARANLAAPNTNTSLNETLDAPNIKALGESSAAAFKDALEKSPDAVGIAVVINGKIEELDIYPNHSVLMKISPRLLQSYAVQAAQAKPANAKPAPEAKEIVTFIQEGKEKSKREEVVNTGNSLRVQRFDNAKAACSTINEGKVVHYQALSNVEAKQEAPQVQQRLIQQREEQRPAR